MFRKRERGGARLKAIFWTAVLLAAIYVTYKIVPAYFANYQLQDKIVEEARFASVNRVTEEKLRDNIFKTIQDLEIPARRDDIKVQITPRGVAISVDYIVPVDLHVYQLELHFTPATENRSI